MAQYRVQAPDGSMITLEGPEGASDEQILAQAKRLWQQDQPPQVPKARSFQSITPFPQAESAALSALSSAAFGVPEWLARQTESGRNYVEGARSAYPKTTTAGDLAGMINPLRLGYKGGSKAIDWLGKKIFTSKPAQQVAKAEKGVARAQNKVNDVQAKLRLDEQANALDEGLRSGKLSMAQYDAGLRDVAAKLKKLPDELQDQRSKSILDLAKAKETAAAANKDLASFAKSTVGRAAQLAGGVAGAQLAGGTTSGIQNDNLAEGIATARAIGEVPEQLLRSVGVPINTNIEEVVPAGMAGIAELLRSILGSGEMSEEEQEQIRTQLELLGPDAVR